ncbi:MAG: hypothetical protein GX410_06550 [Elusimicrobia bacterium]|nr:hypothetical protein [Elusimicrobiota bacterium]
MAVIRVFLTLAFSLLQLLPPAAVFAQEAGASSEDSSFAMPSAPPPGVPLDSPEGREQRKADRYDEATASISPLQKRVTLVVNNVPLTAFLNSISMQAKLNFIVAKDVENEKITASLRGVTVQEALQILLQVRGLSYQRIGSTSTYLITKRATTAPNVITKIYTLNYISLIDSNSLAGSGSALSSGDSGGGGGGGGGSMMSLGGGDSSRSGTGVEIIAVIKGMLTSKGKLSIEPRTNGLIITDVPDVFPQIDALIAELDRKTPQILIEAQIVEVNTDRINELGIDWGGSSGQMVQFVGGSRNTDYFLKDGFFDNGWKTFFPSADTENGAITPGYLSLAQLQVIFRALVSRTEARFLGKPKVVTMNNKPATISLLKHAAVGLKSDVSGSGSVGQTTQEAEREWVGLELQVVPQVNKEGYITMLVVPHFSDVVASAITVNNIAYQDKIERTVKTLVRVKNGQTVVLGGMLYSKDNKVVRKVPLLGYIPIIGWFFSSTSARKQNTDVVMFITPTILVD